MTTTSPATSGALTGARALVGVILEGVDAVMSSGTQAFGGTSNLIGWTHYRYPAYSHTSLWVEPTASSVHVHVSSGEIGVGFWMDVA